MRRWCELTGVCERTRDDLLIGRMFPGCTLVGTAPGTRLTIRPPSA